MRRIQLLALVMVVLIAQSVSAADVTLGEVWELVQAQQAQITSLTEELARTNARLEATTSALDETTRQAAITTQQVSATADYLDDIQAGGGDTQTSLGGYGELHYTRIDADDSTRDLKEADFHRFVMMFGHEFSERVRFFSEFEIEHSLVKDTGDGSNGGEVEIEQAFIEFDLNENHYARAGLFLLPVGILNETHEPPTFYGVERNDVENIIIPSTWWEAGVGAGGHYDNGLSWDFALHSGLEMPTAGGSAFRIRSGRQKVAHANADDLAYTLRVKYTGFPGLEISGSYQHQSDPSQLGNDGLDGGDLLSVHGIWQHGPFSLRALWAQWRFDGAAVALADVDKQTGWYVEPSVKLRIAEHEWGLYTRYEDLDGARTRDRFEQWELGVNYWPTDNVVLKVDYRKREHALNIDAGRDFNAFDLGLGYHF
ncbi:MAG: porin [Gammaproteobacteria bacterium]|nr:porin [Gammaproteobacteria bacterium]